MKKTAFLCLLFFFGCGSNNSISHSTQSYIYIRHIGSSDKPIFPIVFCDAPISEKNKKYFESNSGLTFISIYQLNAPMYVKVVNFAKEAMQIDSKSIAGLRAPEYGTFEIFINKSGKDSIKTLTRREFQKFINATILLLKNDFGNYAGELQLLNNRLKVPYDKP